MRLTIIMLVIIVVKATDAIKFMLGLLLVLVLWTQVPPNQVVNQRRSLLLALVLKRAMLPTGRILMVMVPLAAIH